MSENDGHEYGHEHEPDWSETPEDILRSIAQCLKIYADYIRLRAVCHTWRSLLPQFPPHHIPTQLPWLLLPSSPPYTSTRRHTATTTTTGICRAFYDLPTGKTHSLHLPEASYPRRIVGSSHGSLVLVGDSPAIFCYNPLTQSKTFLPPLSTLPGVVSFSFSNVGREYSIQDPLSENVYTLDLRLMCDTFLSKVILSASPTKDDFLALAIISLSGVNELAYSTCGDTSWKSLPCGDFNPRDVIYCRSEELFYAVNQMGDIAVFGSNTMEIIRNVDRVDSDLKYLVKSKGELLLVARYLEAHADLVAYCEVYETTGFGVYQFREAGEGRVHWEPVTDLGDQIVFVGDNSSLALSALDFPGCKRNCIYYTDDHSRSADVGVYDLSNGLIEALPCYPQDGSAPLRWAPPVWFTPNPC